MQLRNHIKTSDSTEIFQTWLYQRSSELVKYLTTMNPLLFVLKKFRKYARFPTKTQYLWRLLAIYLVVKIWTMSAWKLRTVSSALIIAIEIFYKLFNKKRMKSPSSRIAKIPPLMCSLQLLNKSVHSPGERD